MFKWFDMRKKKSKIKTVNDARKAILAYLNRENHSELIQIFFESIRENDTINYSRVDIEIGSTLFKLKRLILEIDIEVIHAYDSWTFKTVDSKKIIINTKHINSLSDTVETLASSLMCVLGYKTPPNTDEFRRCYLPYQFGRHVRNESFTIQ